MGAAISAWYNLALEKKTAGGGLLYGGGGFLYGQILIFLVAVTAGSGRGTYLPMGIVCSPASLFNVIAALFATPFFWAVVGFVATRDGQQWRYCSVGLLAVHYSGVALVLLAPVKHFAAYKSGDFWKQSEDIKMLSVVALAVYALGQIAIWIRITAAGRRKNPA